MYSSDTSFSERKRRENNVLLSTEYHMFIAVSTIMSTAKRLVLSLAGRKDSHQTGASSTRLVGNSLSPGHELDEIAIVSHTGSDACGRVSYGSLSLNGPRYIPG